MTTRETKEIRWKKAFFRADQVEQVESYRFLNGSDEFIDRYLFISKVLEDITEDNSFCKYTFFREKEVKSLFSKVGDIVPEIKADEKE